LALGYGSSPKCWGFPVIFLQRLKLATSNLARSGWAIPHPQIGQSQIALTVPQIATGVPQIAIAPTVRQFALTVPQIATTVPIIATTIPQIATRVH